MAAKAQLQGHDFDLATLVETFADGDPKVVRNADSFYIEASALDPHFGDGGQLHEIASVILTQFNGVAHLRDSGFRAVKLLDRYVNDAGAAHAVVSAEARLRGQGTLTVGGVPPKVDAPGPRYLSLASSNDDLADLLTLLGDGEELSWPKLYKVYEIILHTVGGGQSGLLATGWTTRDELSAFTVSANSPVVSGAGARHARSSGHPRRTMTLDEGRQFARRLAETWIASLANGEGDQV